MDVLHRCQNTSYQKLRLVFCKLWSIPQSTTQIGSRQQVHYQVKVVSVVEGADHISNKRWVEVLENFPLVEHIIYAFFHDNQSLTHFLHSIKFLASDKLNFPDLTIASLSNYLMEIEVIARRSVFLLGRVFGNFGEGGVQTGLLLRVVDFDDIGEWLFNIVLVFISDLYLF